MTYITFYDVENNPIDVDGDSQTIEYNVPGDLIEAIDFIKKTDIKFDRAYIKSNSYDACVTRNTSLLIGNFMVK